MLVYERHDYGGSETQESYFGTKKGITVWLKRVKKTKKIPRWAQHKGSEGFLEKFAIFLLKS